MKAEYSNLKYKGFVVDLVCSADDNGYYFEKWGIETSEKTRVLKDNPTSKLYKTKEDVLEAFSSKSIKWEKAE